MIDFSNLGEYKENNRIEAKKAQGGLPMSIWETYSSFANTLGGVILLGVEEVKEKGKALNPVPLPNPQWLVDEFWKNINDPMKANKNILTENDVEILNVNGLDIVAITVPKAHRYSKPIFVDGDIHNTYRRSGEGDYRCTMDEIRAMIRDSSLTSSDMEILEELSPEALNMETVNKFRRRCENLRPGNFLEDLDDTKFLLKAGALEEVSGKMHPTSAGLLMFGKKEIILEKFPSLELNYIETFHDNEPYKKIISLDSKDFGGNIYDFYFKVKKRILKTLDVPPLEDGKTEDSSVYNAIFEAVANSLINADYQGTGGIQIINSKNKIEVSNPGSFRLELKTAREGGKGDPRNLNIMKMFNLIDIGNNKGSGIPGIFSIWSKRKWEMPKIKESFIPERITLSLPIGRFGSSSAKIRKSGKTMAKIHEDMIIDYLTDNVSAKLKTIAADLHLSITKTSNAIKKLIDDDIVAFEGERKNRIYRLKA